MFVRILSAPNSDYWYAKYVGHVFSTQDKPIRPDSIHYLIEHKYNQENYPELCDKYQSGQPVLIGGDIVLVNLGSEPTNESMSQLLKKGDF
jgi:hypothetical protein